MRIFVHDHRPQGPTPADGAVGTRLEEARLWVCWRPLRSNYPVECGS